MSRYTPKYPTMGLTNMVSGTGPLFKPHIAEWMRVGTPAWVPKPPRGFLVDVEKGEVDTYDYNTTNMEVYHVCYSKFRDKESGWDRIVVMENGMVSIHMKGMLQELREQCPELAIDFDTGEMCTARGRLSDQDIDIMSNRLLEMHSMWRMFPTESNFKTVASLYSALGDVEKLKHEIQFGYLADGVENLRKQIAETQETLQQREKDINELYERGADALNLLEEHGVEIKMPTERVDSNEIYKVGDPF